ncbi:hypothetical protein [Cardinium endosymbiont of Nabis limbatus]|uniref:hypothetical protein n=1 Tax=Cardinium endosymbiont of Nabis limbatus TaxID=3066217 RepID=UPI003AF3EF86
MLAHLKQRWKLAVCNGVFIHLIGCNASQVKLGIRGELNTSSVATKSSQAPKGTVPDKIEVNEVLSDIHNIFKTTDLNEVIKKFNSSKADKTEELQTDEKEKLRIILDTSQNITDWQLAYPAVRKLLITYKLGDSELSELNKKECIRCITHIINIIKHDAKQYLKIIIKADESCELVEKNYNWEAENNLVQNIKDYLQHSHAILMILKNCNTYSTYISDHIDKLQENFFYATTALNNTQTHATSNSSEATTTTPENSTQSNSSKRRKSPKEGTKKSKHVHFGSDTR